MQIAGNLREFRSILDRARSMKAKLVYFDFPNIVFFISPNGKEYSFFRSTLFVSHPVCLLPTSIYNLLAFFRMGWNKRRSDPKSLFYHLLWESFILKKGEIEIDHNPDGRFQLDVQFADLEVISPFTERIKKISQTSLDLNRPYLKMSSPDFKKIYSRFRKIITEKDFYTTRHNEPNMLYVKNQTLCMEKYNYLKRDELGNLTPSTFDLMGNFTFLTAFADKKYPLYDVDFQHIAQYIRFTRPDSIILIPFESFYMIEGHADQLLFKHRTYLRNAKTVSR